MLQPSDPSPVRTRAKALDRASSILSVPGLTDRERPAVAELIRRLLTMPGLAPERVVLFGSRARGDFRPDSDVDLLLLCGTGLDRTRLGRAHCGIARDITSESGIEVETWTLTRADLRQGRRTPMLIDALDDGVGLWPPGARTPRLRFTRQDAVFCAECLLGWVDTGGHVCRQALSHERDDHAAARARDDIIRMASAVLLLLGETRHRSVGSLGLFEALAVRNGLVPTTVRPALDWAARACPNARVKAGRRLPATPAATRSAVTGYLLARRMQEATLPWICRRIRALSTPPDF